NPSRVIVAREPHRLKRMMPAFLRIKGRMVAVDSPFHVLDQAAVAAQLDRQPIPSKANFWQKFNQATCCGRMHGQAFGTLAYCRTGAPVCEEIDGPSIRTCCQEIELACLLQSLQDRFHSAAISLFGILPLCGI